MKTKIEVTLEYNKIEVVKSMEISLDTVDLSKLHDMVQDVGINSTMTLVNEAFEEIEEKINNPEINEIKKIKNDNKKK